MIVLSGMDTWVGLRAGRELCTLAAQDRSGQVDRVILRWLSLPGGRWAGTRAEYIGTALACSTSVRGKDVVDALKDSLHAAEKPAPISREDLERYVADVRETRDDLRAAGKPTADLDKLLALPPDKLYDRLTDRFADHERVRGFLLTVLGSMGNRAADAVPFLLDEFAAHKVDPAYPAEVRLVLAIAGHEPRANITEMVKVMQGKEFRKRYIDDLLSLMAALPLSDVVSESAKGDIESALTDYLTSQQTQAEERCEAAAALARLGVSSPRTITALNDLMHAVQMPPQLPDGSCSEDDAVLIYEYVTYGYAIACSDATQEKDQIRKILSLAGRYKMIFPIYFFLAGLGTEAPQRITDDALGILSEGDSPAALGAVSLLYGLGGRAPASAQEKLLAVLRQSKDDDLRARAVEAFGAVADPSMAATLVDLAGHEKSQEIKELMLETSKWLRVFGSQPPTDEELGIELESSEEVL